MEEIRNCLLRSKNLAAYRDIISFFEDPIHTNIDDIAKHLDEEIRNETICKLNEARYTYKENRKSYDEEYRFGQALIWQEVLIAYNKMVSTSEKITNIHLCPDLTNYSVALKEIDRLLSCYAEMQIALSNLEQVLGVDRFLDRVSGMTFDVLEELLSAVKINIEELLH